MLWGKKQGAGRTVERRLGRSKRSKTVLQAALPITRRELMQEGKAGRALALKRSEEAHQAKEKEEKPKSDGGRV